MVGSLVYIFYESTLRERVEEHLYDVRMNLAPARDFDTNIILAEISNLTIRLMDGPNAKDLSYSSLFRICQELLKTHARQVVVLLFPNAFPYDVPELETLAGIAAKDPRLLVGTIGITDSKTFGESLPKPFQALKNVAFAADLQFGPKNSVVRNFFLDNPAPSESLVFAMAEQVGGKIVIPEKDTSFYFRDKPLLWINYVRPDRIPSFDAHEILDDSKRELLSGKTVILSYYEYRRWYPQSTKFNSPWERNGADRKDGVSYGKLIAIAFENLLHQTWLKPAASWINVVQILFVSALVLLIWKVNIEVAVLTFIGVWIFLLVLHSVLIAKSSLLIPLSDTALFSSLAVIAGGLWRLRFEGRRRATFEARALSEKQVAHIQERFLDRLASELSKINEKILPILEKYCNHPFQNASAKQAFQKVLGSSEELKDYLEGIQQFTMTQEKAASDTLKVTLVSIEIGPVIQKVLRHFEFRLHEAAIEVFVEGQLAAHVKADVTFLEQILSNLISNAVKYSPPKGRIEINIDEVDRHFVRISIRDYGHGIDPSQHEKIFEKFYRVKDDYVYKMKGHGLGLYLSRFFAAKIGASIKVSSVLGEGATFSLELKRART